MRKFYRTCMICGCHLDPGEPCEDCKRQRIAEQLKEAAPSRVMRYKRRTGKFISFAVEAT